MMTKQDNTKIQYVFLICFSAGEHFHFQPTYDSYLSRKLRLSGEKEVDMINEKWSWMITICSLLSRVSRNNPIKNTTCHWATWHMAHRHLFALLIAAPLLRICPLHFSFLLLHIGQKRSWHLLAFDYALRNLLPSKGLTIWRAEKWRKLLNSCFQYKKSQRLTAFAPLHLCFLFPSSCLSFSGMIKQKQQQWIQDLPTQRNSDLSWVPLLYCARPWTREEKFSIFEGKASSLLKCKPMSHWGREVCFTLSSCHIWCSQFLFMLSGLIHSISSTHKMAQHLNAWECVIC